MPSFDTGHLFLTFLTPVKTGGTTVDLAGMPVSHEQRLRLTLGALPTALQSPATVRIGRMSPFARNRRTHLCRLFLLEDTIFNGRAPSDPLMTAMRGDNPLLPQPLDRLTCPWLVFVADIDAVMNDGDPLPRTLGRAEQARRRDSYLRQLWHTMEPELREIYGNCVGFEGVGSADAFAAYLARCQVDTTMPFHDYWLSAPELPSVDLKRTGAALFGLLALSALGLWIGWGLAAALAGLGALAVLLWALWMTWRHGTAPMPPGEYDDLPSVLKSLYLQQHFTRFVAENQDKSPADLHAAFGAFLSQHRPEDRMAPTQAPGVVSARAAGGTVTAARP